MMYQPQLTPSQIEANRAAQERAWRKIEIARRNAARLAAAKQAQSNVIKETAPEPMAVEKAEPAKPIVPPSFYTAFHRVIMWKGEYCPYAGGSTELVLERSMLEIAVDVLRDHPGVTLGDVKGPSRTRDVVEARHHIVHAIKTERPSISFPQLARWLGGRDHTTILSAYRKMKSKAEGGMA